MEWREPQPLQLSSELIEIAGDALVAMALMRRGLKTAPAARAFLDPAAYTPADPYDFPDMERAVERLQRALAAGERIGVWGDFDVDGQTSTALLVEGLRRLGADVIWHIPIRRTESHGVTIPALQAFLEESVQLMLTCDTGITAHEALDFAAQRGVDVIVTDHHELPDELPSALALINPHRLPDNHPAATLAGVGVAYKLMRALYAELGREDESERFLDLVALGLVADVAILRGDARYLVQRGLQRLRANHRPGLRALLRIAGVRAETLSEEQIGFLIGPHLNAVGRLSDANPMVEFLTTEDEAKARQWAKRLVALNFERKQKMQAVLHQARKQLAAHPEWMKDEGFVLVGETWHPGVIGIVAGRLAEKFHRPVILITTVDGVGRGSARSVEGYDITAAIATQAEHLLGYGGHQLAAGLSLEPEAIPRFRRGFIEALRRQRTEAPPLTPTVELEAWMPWSMLTLDLIDRLERLAPFGAGNPPPLFATGGLEILSYAPLGRTGEHLQLQIAAPDGTTRRVIWWHWDEASIPDGPFDLAYTVRANTFRGTRKVSIEWVAARPTQQRRAPLSPPTLPQMIDLREAPNPMAQIEAIRLSSGGEILLWNESGGGPAGVRRQALQPAATLIVWTAPPSMRMWQWALERVRPTLVVIIGQRPPWEKAGPFLRRLAGLAKYALAHYDGLLSLESLAAATAQCEATVATGLRHLEARGLFTIEESEGNLILHRGNTPDEPAARWWYDQLHIRLDESRAYRNYFLRAPVDQLLAIPSSHP